MSKALATWRRRVTKGARAGVFGLGVAAGMAPLAHGQGTPRLPVIAGNSKISVLVALDGSVRIWGRTSGDSRLSFGDGVDPFEREDTVMVPRPLAGLSTAVGAAVGDYSAFILLADGTALGWGRNDHCDVGNGGTPDELHGELGPVFAPVPVSGLRGAVQVVAKYGVAGAVIGDGSVRMWGRGDGGLLGNGAFSRMGDHPMPPCAPEPRAVDGLTGITQLSLGPKHVLALRSDGSVWAWGDNEDGQLGDGTMEGRGRPVRVVGINNAVSVAADENASAAVLADGTVRTWGNGVNNRLGRPASQASGAKPGAVAGVAAAVSVRAYPGGFIVRLKDGTLHAWGDGYFSARGTKSDARLASPTGLGPVVAHYTAGYRSYAMKADGTVMAWGEIRMMTLDGMKEVAAMPVAVFKVAMPK